MVKKGILRKKARGMLPKLRNFIRRIHKSVFFRGWQPIAAETLGMKKLVDYEGDKVHLFRKVVKFKHGAIGKQRVLMIVGITFREGEGITRAIIFIAPRIEEIKKSGGVVRIGNITSSMQREAFDRERSKLEGLAKRLAKQEGIDTRKLKILFIYGR